MVRRRAGNDVDRRIGERFAHIGDDLRLAPGLFLNIFSAIFGARKIGIAEVKDFGTPVREEFADMAAGATAATDDRHAEFFVSGNFFRVLSAGRSREPKAARRRGRGRRRQKSVAHKTSSRNRFHRKYSENNVKKSGKSSKTRSTPSENALKLLQRRTRFRSLRRGIAKNLAERTPPTPKIDLGD